MTREEMDQLLCAEVWPCCWTAVVVLVSMQTQWRTGPGGRVGLDYNTLPFVLETTDVPRAEWRQVLADLQVMEDEALAIFYEGSDG
jgi:hypothetical protein